MTTTIRIGQFRCAEDIVLAVFHLLGPNQRICRTNALDHVFNEVAEDHGGIFMQFRWHPHYHFSRALDRAINMLLLGGSIRGEVLGQNLYSTPHTLGLYGKRIFETFSSSEQHILRTLAEKLLAKEVTLA